MSPQVRVFYLRFSEHFGGRQHNFEVMVLALGLVASCWLALLRTCDEVRHADRVVLDGIRGGCEVTAVLR